MICRGSYGEITGARSAVTTSARTIRPPTAPSGFRLANRATALQGAASPGDARRISRIAFPAAASLAAVSSSWRRIPTGTPPSHRRARHSGREGEIVERQRQSREDQLLQVEEWIIPHRGVAQGRQPLEEVREKVHDEDAEPERRQRDADARENSAEVIQPGVLFH